MSSTGYCSRDRGSCRSTKQALEFPLGNTVGSPGKVLQAFSIENDNRAAARADQPVAFKHMERRRHARAPDTQHRGNIFVGDVELIGPDPVVAHQYPACQSLLDLEARIGERGIGDLGGEDMHIFDERAPGTTNSLRW